MPDDTNHTILKARKVDEWCINDTLRSFFNHDKHYFCIYQDPELGLYAGRVLKPIREASLSQAKIKLEQVETNRGTTLCVNPKTFKPDSIFLDKTGKGYIVETKIEKINSTTLCDKLVLQTLCYANLFITPYWYSKTPDFVESGKTTFDLLEDLHEASWHLKYDNAAIYRPFDHRHAQFFNLPAPLPPESFSQVPAVIFLLDKYSQERLLEACKRVKTMSFADYDHYISGTAASSYNLYNRMPSLERNWSKLSQMEFFHLQLNVASFANAIAPHPTPLA